MKQRCAICMEYVPAGPVQMATHLERRHSQEVVMTTKKRKPYVNPMSKVKPPAKCPVCGASTGGKPGIYHVFNKLLTCSHGATLRAGIKHVIKVPLVGALHA